MTNICPKCGAECYHTQDAPCAKIRVCPKCGETERVCRPLVELAAVTAERDALLAEVERLRSENAALNVALFHTPNTPTGEGD